MGGDDLTLCPTGCNYHFSCLIVTHDPNAQQLPQLEVHQMCSELETAVCSSVLLVFFNPSFGHCHGNPLVLTSASRV